MPFLQILGGVSVARTSIPIQTVPFQKGAAIVYNAVDSGNGMMFENDGNTVLIVQNNGGSPVNVTVRAVPDEAGRSVDHVQAVGAGQVAILGPFRQRWWNQTAQDMGKVYVDFSASASVSVAALRLQP